MRSLVVFFCLLFSIVLSVKVSVEVNSNSDSNSNNPSNTNGNSISTDSSASSGSNSIPGSQPAPPKPNPALECGGRTQENCENNPSCVKLTGVPVTGPTSPVYLACGLRTACNTTANTTGVTKCVRRANVPGHAIYRVPASCNVYSGIASATCPGAIPDDDRREVDSEILEFSGCVTSVLRVFQFRPTLYEGQLCHKMVYMFEVKPAANFTATSGPSFSVTDLRFEFALSDKTTLHSHVGFKSFNYSSAEGYGFPELFTILPKQGERFFGLVTYVPVDETSDITYLYNCTTMPTASAPPPPRTVDLILTLEADTDFFNKTLYVDAVAEVLNISSSSVSIASQSWVKRVVQESQLILTITDPIAPTYVSRFFSLFVIEDPSLAENGIYLTDVAYSVPGGGPSPTDDGSSPLSKGAIAGIVVAAVVGSLIIIGAVVLIARSGGSTKRDDAKTQMLY